MVVWKMFQENFIYNMGPARFKTGYFNKLTGRLNSAYRPKPMVHSLWMPVLPSIKVKTAFSKTLIKLTVDSVNRPVSQNYNRCFLVGFEQFRLCSIEKSNYELRLVLHEYTQSIQYRSLYIYSLPRSRQAHCFHSII